MTTDTKQLAADIARVMELDAKRTPGPRGFEGPENEKVNPNFGLWEVLSGKVSVCAYCSKQDVLLIAAAPLMADIIRRQQEVIRELSESLTQRNYSIGADAFERAGKAIALAAPLLDKEIL